MLCTHGKSVDGYCEYCDLHRYKSSTQLEAFVFDLYEGPQLQTQPELERADDLLPETGSTQKTKKNKYDRYLRGLSKEVECKGDVCKINPKRAGGVNDTEVIFEEDIFNISNVNSDINNVSPGMECEGHNPPCPKNCIEVGGRCVTVTNWIKGRGINPNIPMRESGQEFQDYEYRDYVGLETPTRQRKQYIDRYIPSSIRGSGKDWRDYDIKTPVRQRKQYVDMFIPPTPAVLSD